MNALPSQTVALAESNEEELDQADRSGNDSSDEDSRDKNA